jgi:heme oxygenase
LIAALRRATSPQHAAIEQVLGLGEAVELPHYHRVLRAFEAFLRVWEPLVAARLPAGQAAWAAGRSRLSMVRRDLQALRLSPQDQACAPVLPDAAAAWGSLYVIEGSALGGQVISRVLERQHGMTPADGAAYFHGWGASTGAMWREFQLALEREAGAGDRQSACAGAVATFDALSTTFRMAEYEHVAA